MFIVTGGLGFIGSSIIGALSKMGERVLVVDYLDVGSGFRNKIDNLSGCASSVIDVIEPENFLKYHEKILTDVKITGIFHQGACADTTVTDGKKMLEQNSDFTRQVILAAVKHGKRIVYASSAAVYGKGTSFEEVPQNENPSNVYGLSKLLSDNFARYISERVVLQDHMTSPQIVGLRYFNVYGKNEDHKGQMSSMVHKLAGQTVCGQPLKLFKSDEVGDGNQKRDFIHVNDVVDVNIHFMFGPAFCGVFNVGTGLARSFNTIAHTLIEEFGSGQIEYIKMPSSIRTFYQNYTCADLRKLRATGYEKEFTSIEDGVKMKLEEIRGKNLDATEERAGSTS